jgi:uncharacterized phiE125 gp8 family phage protein
MWYPPVVTVAETTGPVTIDDALLHCRADDSDPSDIASVMLYLAAAVAHVEQYLGTPLASRTVTVQADYFSDFARLPFAPVTSITSISYFDAAGATQTLSATVYRLIASGIEAFIELKPDQTWPTTKSGERITVTAVVGYASLPFDIRAAILLMTASLFANRENVVVGTIINELPMGVAALLCNHRVNA